MCMNEINGRNHEKKDPELDKEQLEKVRDLLSEKEKWKHFFEILCRKYVYIPSIIVLVYIIDNPDINIVGYVLKFLRRMAGV